MIFDIQRFCVHDGPGIRTVVFLKGCPLRCVFCHNPEGQSPIPEIAFIKERCVRCGRCATVCPEKAQLFQGERVFIRHRCNNCGKCVSVCYREALVIYGREMSVEDVVDEIERDRAFYDNSQGGVTISGGEPLMQHDFTKKVLEECQEKGIETALETCGFVDPKVFDEILECTDLVLYDLKSVDPVKHKSITGVSNELIIDNLRKLVETYTKFIVRVPMIPELNDSSKDLRMFRDLLNEISGIRKPEAVNLLPFHRLAQPKYRRLGRVYPLGNLQPYSEERIRWLVNSFKDRGICVTID